MLRKHSWLLLFLSWMTFVTWMSLASFSESDLPHFNIKNIDKLVHFTFYFIAVVLMIMAMHTEKAHLWSFEKIAVLSFIAMVFFGIIIEVLQYNFTSVRMGDPFDALANSVGALCGALAMKFVIQKMKGLNWKQ